MAKLSINDNVHKLLLSRFKQGMISYAKPIDSEDKDALQWITDTQEELLDAVVYLEALKEKLS